MRNDGTERRWPRERPEPMAPDELPHRSAPAWTTLADAPGKDAPWEAAPHTAARAGGGFP